LTMSMEMFTCWLGWTCSGEILSLEAEKLAGFSDAGSISAMIELPISISSSAVLSEIVTSSSSVPASINNVIKFYVLSIRDVGEFKSETPASL
jgi:hypothetical protein